MPKTDQGITSNRFQVIPRVLIFVFNGDEVLLLEGASNKRIWANCYNGIGGHVELGEDILSAAERELQEESGLSSILLDLCGTILVNVTQVTGILLFVFRGEYSGQALIELHEGKLSWIKTDLYSALPLVEDLPVILPEVIRWKPGDAPFYGFSYYDENEKLIIKICR